MTTLELSINFVCERCRKELQGTQVYGNLVKVRPCPCLVNDYKKSVEEGRSYISEKDLEENV